MPVYNSMATLERALRSVQRQTFADWELLVVDDCSTDGSHETINKWAAADSRIRLIRSTENRGAGAARNLGLRSARGEFITYLDADDEYDPQYLENVARLRDKGDVLVFGYDFIEDDGRSPHPDPLPKGEGTNGNPLPKGEGTKGKPLPDGDGTTPSPCPLPRGEGTARVRTWQPEANRRHMFEVNIVTPLGLAHRREWFDKVGGFNELVSHDTDTDFVRRLARAGAEFAFFPLKSGRYHIRSGSVSRVPRLTPWQRRKVERNYEARKPIYGDRPATTKAKAVRTITFASPHCLIDFTSGAAIATLQALRFLSTLGFKCQAFCGSQLDAPEEALFEELLANQKSPYQTRSAQVGSYKARMTFTLQGDVPAGQGKGDRSNLPERPATNLRSVPGVAQIGPVPFSPSSLNDLA